jgi:tRNA splicing ligase
LSAIFEVVDPVNDPHIVEYKTRHVILLDLVVRSETYDKWEYRQVKGVAKSYGLEYKQLVNRLDTWDQFIAWYETVVNQDTLTQQEGYVVEDSTGFMIKVKLPWYTHWKLMRRVKDMLVAGKPISDKLLTSPEAISFHKWLTSLDKSQLESRDIISLRKEYLTL